MDASLVNDSEISEEIGRDVGNPARELMRLMTLRFFRYIHSRSKPYRINVGGKTFIVNPGVFTPSFHNIVSTKASELLALNLRVQIGARVLDLGTGTGIQGIFASDRAARVVGTDINPDAVKCAAKNIKLNNVTNMEVRAGDLFAPVKGERFDLIVWLPPAFFVTPRTVAERAFACDRNGEVLARFCRQASDYLSPDGMIQFSCVDRTRQFILHHLALNGFRFEQIKKVRRLPMETCTQFLAWPR
jgi:HemK-related putative methylase